MGIKWAKKIFKLQGGKYKKAVIKNSIYFSISQAVSKISALLFTIIIARILSIEMFGLYSLSFTTIILVTAIAELGLNNTMVRFVSRDRANKKKKTREYIKYFYKLKIYLLLISVLILIVTSFFLAKNYYQKPILAALLGGGFYIFFSGLSLFIDGILQSLNKFGDFIKKEILFNALKLLFVPLITFIIVKFSLPGDIIASIIIISLSGCYLLTGVFSYWAFIKRKKVLDNNEEKLGVEEKREINKFLYTLAPIVLLGIFFSIDTIMLGRYVSLEFVGYYSLALGLLGAVGTFVSFSIVLLPIFSEMRDLQREKAMDKTLKGISFLSVGLTLILFFIAPFIVKMIYGSKYLIGGEILKFLSLWLLSYSLISVYSSYFVSKAKQTKIMNSLIATIVLNIILNYFLITILIDKGELFALYGAGAATILSNIFYLFSLYFARRKIRNENNKPM